MQQSQWIKTGIAGIAGVLGLALASSAFARQPFTAEELAQQEAALLKAVDTGYNYWHGTKPSMTTNGLACGNCHPDAAASNPQTFPKYMSMFGDVTTFREMINWCIENPQAGQAIDVNSADMTALEAYAFYLHRGKPIEPGLAARQTTPVVVKSGTGYARTPTGLGVDK